MRQAYIENVFVKFSNGEKYLCYHNHMKEWHLLDDEEAQTVEKTYSNFDKFYSYAYNYYHGFIPKETRTGVRYVSIRIKDDGHLSVMEGNDSLFPITMIYEHKPVDMTMEYAMNRLTVREFKKYWESLN